MWVVNVACTGSRSPGPFIYRAEGSWGGFRDMFVYRSIEGVPSISVETNCKEGKVKVY